jgi:hypothetical protein
VAGIRHREEINNLSSNIILLLKQLAPAVKELRHLGKRRMMMRVNFLTTLQMMTLEVSSKINTEIIWLALSLVLCLQVEVPQDQAVTIMCRLHPVLPFLISGEMLH